MSSDNDTKITIIEQMYKDAGIGDSWEERQAFHEKQLDSLIKVCKKTSEEIIQEGQKSDDIKFTKEELEFISCLLALKQPFYSYTAEDEHLLVYENFYKIKQSILQKISANLELHPKFRTAKFTRTLEG